MFERKKRNIPQGKIDSLIGASTTIHGDLEFAGGLRIDGHIVGNISSTSGTPSTLVISSSASVEGEIRVNHVMIDGTVKGPVYAAEYVELLPNANITGDVSYKTLEMQVGAIIDGRLLHLQSQSSSADVLELKRNASVGESITAQAKG